MGNTIAVTGTTSFAAEGIRKIIGVFRQSEKYQGPCTWRSWVHFRTSGCNFQLNSDYFSGFLWAEVADFGLSLGLNCFLAKKGRTGAELVL